MPFRKTIIVVLLIAGFSSLKAQVIELYMVNIKGVITSATLGEPIPFAQIINPKVHGGTSSDVDGYFSINMLTEDTLIIRSMGFIDYYFTVKEFPPKALYEIKMTPKSYQLKEVTVTDNSRLKRNLGIPDAKPLDVPTELRSGTFNEKPTVLAALFSPVSFLTYHLSADEKNKRETLKAIKNGEEWDQFSTYHNLEAIKRLTGLEGDEADAFMIYCNLNNQLPYNAGQLQIEFQIMDLFFKFKKMKAEQADTIAPPKN
jgi:hypothetical protein